MSINKSVFKSASIIAAATLASRFLGLIRDIVIARYFGVYIYAQAFVVAFKIPNLLRDFVAEGAVNSALVPVFSEYHLSRSKEEFWEAANIVLQVFLIALVSLACLGVIAAPVIVRLIAPGFAASPEKLEITVRLTQVIFPYIVLVSLAAYAMGILNSLKHFSIPAFAPCLLNISIILCAMFLGEGVTGLASGVLIGGLMQVAIQVPVLYRKGFRLRRIRDWRHPILAQIGRLMLPRVASSGIYQLNNFVDTMFGSLAWIVGEGGVAALYFAYRLVQFPLGIFSTALSQAILPTLSRQSMEADYGQLKQTISWGLRATIFVMAPATVGLLVLARPIIAVLFLARNFDFYAANLTAAALFFYSFGLAAYGVTRILQSGFFALKDTVTPAKIAAAALGMNIVLNLLLMFWLRLGGIALATSLSGAVTSLMLFAALKRKIGDFGTRAIMVSAARIGCASLGMGVVLAAFVRYRGASVVTYMGLGLSLVVGILAYTLFSWALRVPEMRQLWGWVRNKSK